MLLAELEEFVTRHGPHGQLTGDATEPAASGYMVTVACSCGVTHAVGYETESVFLGACRVK